MFNKIKETIIVALLPPRTLRFYLFIFLLLSCLSSSILFAAPPDPNRQQPLSTTPEIKMLQELRSVVQTLREERSVFYEKQQQFESHIQQKHDDLADLDSQLSELRAQQEHLDQDLAQIEQDVSKLTSELQSHQTQQAQWQKSMEQWIRRGLISVDAGIPFRQSQRRKLLAPQQEAAAPESFNAAETLGQIWRFFQEEMRLAQSGETYTQSLDIGDQRIKYAQIFRLGHLVLGYLTEDAQETGLWLTQNGTKQWQHTLTHKDDRAVRDAVEILNRRQEPKFISLPLSLQIERVRTEE